MGQQTADSRRVRRRSVLRSAGVSGLLGIAGCLGGDDGSTDDATTTDDDPPGNAQFRTDLGLEYPDYEIGNRLNILQWTDYWEPKTLPDFEDAFGVETTLTSYGSNEEMLEILRRDGFDAYDLAVPSDWMVTNLIDRDPSRVQALDLDKIPNWENLGERWREDAPYDRGDDRYSAPYLWGTTGIGWHDAMVDGSLDTIDHLDSWDAMWNETYSGQIQMLDLPRETYAVALKQLGYSLNTTDPEKISEATELLIQQTDLVREYTGEQLRDDLLNKRATPLHTFSGAALGAQIQLREDGESPIAYRIPREGGVVWIDTMVIPQKARHPNLAHTFINYILSPKVGADNAEFNVYASPNEAAKEIISEDLLQNPALYPPSDVQAKLEFIQDVDDAWTHYEDGWNKIRNA